MALGNNNCVECEKLQLRLIEKDNEIEKLKLHIQNLTNYLLCKKNYPEEHLQFQDSKTSDESIKEFTIDQKFYSSELFLKSCDSLNGHITLKSKSVQTDDYGKF